MRLYLKKKAKIQDLDNVSVGKMLATWTMVQLAKCLPHKLEDMSLDSQHHTKAKS